MNLNGKWYNELGSAMTLKVEGKKITGTYHTTVGDASGTYDLIGQTDTNKDGSQMVGFVVAWNNQEGNSEAVTAWSGQYQMIDGEEIIMAAWLLTQETAVDDDWKLTVVNKDIFTRTAPTKEEIQRHRRRGTKHSHPNRK